MLLPFYAVVAGGIVTFWITSFLLAFLVSASLFLDVVLLRIEASAGVLFLFRPFFGFCLLWDLLLWGTVWCFPSHLTHIFPLLIRGLAGHYR